MTSKAALLTLLTLWGVGAAVPHQAWADETAAEQSSDSKDEPASDLTNRVWVKAGDEWQWHGMFEDLPLPLAWPVYVSQAEANAFARWQGRRCELPVGPA